MVVSLTEVQNKNKMENPKNQLISRLKEANNVLVTVSANPSVDQLAAAIGLGLFLNKLGKHATAVFSGATPPTLNFLQPDKTLAKTTDSLRDFIISLDKSKADKLRYKVEDEHVKIFITPYHTALSERDLEFSQGDFNIDVIIALGVREQKELDQAITAHGRILHDATVATVMNTSGSKLGTINWVDGGASSLSEMAASLAEQLEPNAMDGQMATAFLTGIVAETARFSNEKTTSATMSVSAKLMAAGANQQLVATQLQPKPAPAPEPPAPPEQPLTVTEPPQRADDGSLQISHEEARPPEPPLPPADEPEEDTEDGEEPINQIHIDREGYLKPLEEAKPEPPEDEEKPSGSPFVLHPPSLGGTLTANSRPEDLAPSTDSLSLPPVSGPLLSHDAPPAQPDTAQPQESVVPPAAKPEPHHDEPFAPQNKASDGYPDPYIETTPTEDAPQTLADIEKAVDSPHVQQAGATGKDDEPPALGEARDAVMQAINSNPDNPLEPVEALNAQPLDLGNGTEQPAQESELSLPGTQGAEFTLPDNLMPPDTGLPPDESAPSVSDPSSPPPVPPPMMPPLPGANGFDPYTAGMPPLPDQDQLPQPGDDKPPANPQNPFNLPPA